jgi:hypothetical protein
MGGSKLRVKTKIKAIADALDTCVTEVQTVQTAGLADGYTDELLSYILRLATQTPQVPTPAQVSQVSLNCQTPWLILKTLTTL